MSEQSTGERSGAELPPGWTASTASTTGGTLYVAVWQAFPDATAFEYDLALAPALGHDSAWQSGADAVARVRALREARDGRPDLREDDWQWCVRLVWPQLSEQGRQNPKEILTAVAALRPHDDNAVAARPRGLSGEAAAALAPRKPGRPGWTRRLFDERWEAAYRLAEEPKTIPNMADHFEALDGTVGIDPEHLRRLKRRCQQGQLPE